MLRVGALNELKTIRIFQSFISSSLIIFYCDNLLRIKTINGIQGVSEIYIINNIMFCFQVARCLGLSNNRNIFILLTQATKILNKFE